MKLRRVKQMLRVSAASMVICTSVRNFKKNNRKRERSRRFCKKNNEIENGKVLLFKSSSVFLQTVRKYAIGLQAMAPRKTPSADPFGLSNRMMYFLGAI